MYFKLQRAIEKWSTDEEIVTRFGECEVYFIIHTRWWLYLTPLYEKIIGSTAYKLSANKLFAQMHPISMLPRYHDIPTARRLLSELFEMDLHSISTAQIKGYDDDDIYPFAQFGFNIEGSPFDAQGRYYFQITYKRTEI